MSSGRASTRQLAELHRLLTRRLADRIDSEDATAADLNVAVALLRDNSVTAPTDADTRRLRRLYSRVLAALLRAIEAGDAPPALLAVAERFLQHAQVKQGAFPMSDAERKAQMARVLASVPFRVQ
jgi:hypothetical protein